MIPRRNIRAASISAEPSIYCNNKKQKIEAIRKIYKKDPKMQTSASAFSQCRINRSPAEENGICSSFPGLFILRQAFFRTFLLRSLIQL